jgi:hypothetical protein
MCVLQKRVFMLVDKQGHSHQVYAQMVLLFVLRLQCFAGIGNGAFCAVNGTCHYFRLALPLHHDVRRIVLQTFPLPTRA